MSETEIEKARLAIQEQADRIFEGVLDQLDFYGQATVDNQKKLEREFSKLTITTELFETTNILVDALHDISFHSEFLKETVQGVKILTTSAFNIMKAQSKNKEKVELKVAKSIQKELKKWADEREASEKARRQYVA